MLTFIIVAVVMVVLALAFAKGTGMKLKKGGKPSRGNGDFGSHSGPGIP